MAKNLVLDLILVLLAQICPPPPQIFFLDKMAKNVILGPIFVCFGPNVVPKSFLRGFYLYWMLYIVASYHCMQFQVKLMNQTWENGKKPSFGLDFDPFCPNLGPNFYFVDFTCQFAIMLTSYVINIEKILNRPITKFYKGDDVNVIAAEFRLTKTRPNSFIRNIIFYKKQCQLM